MGLVSRLPDGYQVMIKPGQDGEYPKLFLGTKPYPIYAHISADGIDVFLLVNEAEEFTWLDVKKTRLA